MIFLSVNSANNYSEWFGILAIVVGLIVGILTTYWLIYQSIQSRKNIKEKQRKLSIRPVFKTFDNIYSPTRNNLNLKLFLSGGSARIVDVKNLQSDLVNLTSCSSARNHDLINCDNYITLCVSNYPANKFNIGEFDLNFKLVFKDIEENVYSQNFQGTSSNGIKTNEPVEII